MLFVLAAGNLAAHVAARGGLKTTPKNWGVQNFHGHWEMTDRHETELAAHTIAEPSAGTVGVATYFWLEAGRGPSGRYHCDTMIIRYYVDNETNASLAFTPSMAAGSGVGLEPLAYYSADQNANPRGSKPCVGQGDQCGMDLMDGWPWQTRWTGKGGSEGNWILHLRVPFKRSLRVTAQVASNASHIDSRFARPDIPEGTSSAGYVMIRGLEGPEELLRIELGGPTLPPIGSGNVRLRLQHLANHTPKRGEFVPLARLNETGLSGAVLMMTLSLQGMHTVPNDVEMCWWALTTPTASYFNGDEHLLIGTGMEDFFGNSFSLSRLTRNYYNDDAGVSHIHGGPQDSCPTPRNATYPTCSADFQTRYPKVFSAYRAFGKDVLVFDDQLDLSVRYLPPGGTKGKCSLRPSHGPPQDDDDGRYGEVDAKIATGKASITPRFDSYVWFYTYER